MTVPLQRLMLLSMVCLSLLQLNFQQVASRHLMSEHSDALGDLVPLSEQRLATRSRMARSPEFDAKQGSGSQQVQANAAAVVAPRGLAVDMRLPCANTGRQCLQVGCGKVMGQGKDGCKHAGMHAG